MIRLLRTGLGSCVLAFVILTGCGAVDKSVWLKGVVVYDGKPVEDAGITFQPAEATGNPVASRVADGKFLVRVVPGKYRVSVTSLPSADNNRNGPARSYEEYKARQINPAEMQKMARASRDEQKKFANKVEGNEIIPENARGNNAEYTVVANQELTIVLNKPKQ